METALEVLSRAATMVNAASGKFNVPIDTSIPIKFNE